jgi:hypothetical protein
MAVVGEAPSIWVEEPPRTRTTADLLEQGHERGHLSSRIRCNSGGLSADKRHYVK